MLLEDSRTTFKDIADRVDLTSTSVATRVGNLHNEGIIIQGCIDAFQTAYQNIISAV